LAQASSLGSILSNVEVHPPVFTPQGDGVNDLVQFNYNLLSIQTGVEVEIAVHSLDGKQQRQLFSKQQSAGPHGVVWDGRDETGQLLAPGIYLVQIAAKTDKGQLTQTRPIYIAY
jgi:flagellar hook assembly protein FlgD